MPPNAQAVEVTARFRRQLLSLRDAVARSIAQRLGDIDFDGGRRSIDGALAEWERNASLLVGLAQQQSARLADIYVSGFMSTADLVPEVDVDVAAHVGRDLAGESLTSALHSAPVALLWRLGRGDGRSAALASGMDRAIRVSRGAVMTSARSVIAERVEREPRISGWRRVTASKPCGACLARSGVLMTSAVVFETHDRCGCHAEPVLRDVPERVQRPTGQQRWDAMSPAERAELLHGAGGATKAAAVTDVNQLVAHVHGQMVEAPLRAVAQ